MNLAGIRPGALRLVLLSLAVLALVVRISVPQGFMVASSAEGGAQLVICTGHGPLKAAPGAPADKSRPDGACAFAGHGAGAAPEPAPMVEAIAFAAAAQAEPALPADLAPGRGLAAPPPPSLAPPQEV